MSSILKVDQLQDSGGNAIITSDGSGNVTQSKAGITMADQWRMTADLTADADPISSNLERVDDGSFGYIGSGMSVSSGTWTFPSTGIYHVSFTTLTSGTTANDNVFIELQTTTDNSTYLADARPAGGTNGTNVVTPIFAEMFFDVEDTTTHKMRFRLLSLSSGNLIRGNTDYNETSFTFIRLGDT
jgi:hypothetical protein